MISKLRVSYFLKKNGTVLPVLVFFWFVHLGKLLLTTFKCVLDLWQWVSLLHPRSIVSFYLQTLLLLDITDCLRLFSASVFWNLMIKEVYDIGFFFITFFNQSTFLLRWISRFCPFIILSFLFFKYYFIIASLFQASSRIFSLTIFALATLHFNNRVELH
jgi:hypothetical protein